METTTKFSIKRVLLLLKKHILEVKNYYLKIIIIIFGISIFALIISFFSEKEMTAYISVLYNYGFFMFVIVIFFSLFPDLRKKEKTISYLTIPATSLEKIISELFFSTVLFFIAYNLLFYVYNIFLLCVGKLVGLEVEIISIFSSNIMKMWGGYIILHSIFFAGATAFRHHIRSTLLTTILFGFAVIIYITLLVLIVLYINKLKTGVFPTQITNEKLNLSGKEALENFKFLFYFAKYFILFALAPIFWTIAYFKLKEKQI